MPVTMRGGREYATVNERLEAAHGDGIRPEGIQRVESECLTVGEAVLVVSRVTFGDGRVFTGMSQARFGAAGGADATNPIECAETSSVGRALAMAGFFVSETGIAGAEEIRTAQRIEQARQRPPMAARPAPAQAPAASGSQAPKTAPAVRNAPPGPARPPTPPAGNDLAHVPDGSDPDAVLAYLRGLEGQPISAVMSKYLQFVQQAHSLGLRSITRLAIDAPDEDVKEEGNALWKRLQIAKRNHQQSSSK